MLNVRVRSASTDALPTPYRRPKPDYAHPPQTAPELLVERYVPRLDHSAKRSMCQQHCAREKLFADFAGPTLPILARDISMAYRGHFLSPRPAHPTLHVRVRDLLNAMSGHSASTAARRRFSIPSR